MFALSKGSFREQKLALSKCQTAATMSLITSIISGNVVIMTGHLIIQQKVVSQSIVSVKFEYEYKHKPAADLFLVVFSNISISEKLFSSLVSSMFYVENINNVNWSLGTEHSKMWNVVTEYERIRTGRRVVSVPAGPLSSLMTTVRSYTATVALTPVRPSASHPIGVINRGPITAMVPLTPRPPLRVPLAPGGPGQVGGCEGRVARGVQWPPTLKGETVERPCPKGSLGRCGVCFGVCVSVSRFLLKRSQVSNLWTQTRRGEKKNERGVSVRRDAGFGNSSSHWAAASPSHPPSEKTLWCRLCW